MSLSNKERGNERKNETNEINTEEILVPLIVLCLHRPVHSTVIPTYVRSLTA